MATNISVVGHKEQKTALDFEWESHKYLNIKFKRMATPVHVSYYDQYDAETADLTKQWKMKTANDATNIDNQQFLDRYVLLGDYLRAEEEMLSVQG